MQQRSNLKNTYYTKKRNIYIVVIPPHNMRYTNMAEFVNYNGKDYKVRYSHSRLVDLDGNTSPKGGATIAYISDSRHDNQQPPLVSEMAVCSEKDTYDKKLGRIIALGRLKKKLSGSSGSN